MNIIKFKFIFIFFLGLVLSTMIFAFLNVNSDTFKLKYAALTVYNYPSDDTVADYFEQLTKIIQKNHQLLKTQDDLQVYDFDLAALYQEKIALKNNNFQPSILQIDKYQKIRPIDYKYVQAIDDTFPKGYSYVKTGELGADIDNIWDIEISDTTIKKKTVTISSLHKDPSSEVVYFGDRDLEATISGLKSVFNSFLKEDSSNTHFRKLVYPEDKTKLENITIESIKLNDTENKILTLSESFEFGNFNIKLGNCNKARILNFSYIPELALYEFPTEQNFLDNLCIKQFTEVDGYLVGTCTDCNLYPADKTHALKGNYTPEVVPVDFAPGFQRINKVAFNDFYEMYKAARADGVNLYVTSGYRSYSDQLSTFEYWTAIEMGKGYSRSQAEAMANTYSARPGFSEHQLGTALDLNGAGCDSFSDCTGNQTAWNWLASNAFRFGFIISYPSGKESLTGYIYEPWHYRWIGKELAVEYKNVESETYLQKWLFELGRY